MRGPDPVLEERMLRAAPEDALGLAAPQIGVSRQLLFIREPGEEPLWIYNPRLETRGVQNEGAEGCLSLPDKMFMVSRWSHVSWKGRSTSWEKIDGEAQDLRARILQHENDHLRGILVSDIGEELVPCE